ncbi:MAG: DUF3098 domain-containing protein [Flavobacteriales bacterium]|nr:DUF3098 domain-containing protein [Flavobacteriales bacterium]MCC6939277.1 DUF3098 domain-containing protein [Flavobacteriales bacterium]
MAKKDHFEDMAFTAINYKLMLIGLAIVVVGYVLMSGGGSGDPNVFDESEIFSPRRITAAPIITLIGYLFVVYAIMKRDYSK